MSAETPENHPLVLTQGSTSAPPAQVTPRCEATTRAGTRCKSAPMVGSRYCFSHDPACADAKHAACRRGGIVSSERKVMPADTEPAQLETPEDVRRFISETVHK